MHRIAMVARLTWSLGLTLALTACGDDGADAPPDAAPARLACAEPAGPGTQHAGPLAADETWTAAEGPHIVTADVVVRSGRTLTIEACAVVRVQESRSIVVGGFSTSDGTGTLIARGGALEATATEPALVRPVRVISDAPSAWWGSLQVLATGTADLGVVILDRGGDPAQSQGGGGTLLMRGDDNRLVLVRNVRAQSLVISNSATYAVNVRGSAAFTEDSADVAITGAGSRGAAGGGEDTRYAMYLEAPAIRSLPPSTVITEGTKNEVLVAAPFTVAVDERFPRLAVPYQLRGSFAMQPTTQGALITLTIDPGVTLKLGGPLASNPSIRLGSGDGTATSFPVRLNAAGTATAPITITSGAATPAPGDWAAIDWQAGPATGNVLANAVVEYGGGDSQTTGFGCGPGDNDALILITDWRPDNAFIQGSTFRHSAAGGIVSGWRSDAAGPDLRGGNTFASLGAACEISLPRSAAGMCPGNDPNPDCY